MTIEEKQAEHEEIIQEAPIEYEFDMNNMPTQNHKWVDRGTFLSCEGAGHPNHRHHKR